MGTDAIAGKLPYSPVTIESIVDTNNPYSSLKIILSHEEETPRPIIGSVPQKMPVVRALNNLDGSSGFSVEYCKPGTGPPRDDNKVWAFRMEDNTVPSTRRLGAEQQVVVESRDAKCAGISAKAAQKSVGALPDRQRVTVFDPRPEGQTSRADPKETSQQSSSTNPRQDC